MTADVIVPGMAETIEQRRTELGIARGVLADLAGVSRETLRPVLKGFERDYNDDTVFGLARALRWRNDWYSRLREGLAPVEHVADSDLAEEIKTLRQEIAALTAELRAAGILGDGPAESPEDA